MKPKINQLKVGVILSYISRIITVVVGLIYTPIMIRLLGQNEYGLYNIAASTISYLGILNFGFGSAYMRFYSRYKVNEDHQKIAILNSMFLTIFSLLGIFVIIAGVILALNVDLIFKETLSHQELHTAQTLILILVVNLSVSFPAIIFNTYLQANEQFVFQNVFLILAQITTPLINLPILLAGYGSVGMVIGMVTINIILEVIIFIYCILKMEMHFLFKDFDRHLMLEMTIFSSYIFVNMVVEQINNNVDKTILGRFHGTIPVAIYSIGSNLNIYYQQLSLTISNVFTPRVHRLVAEKGTDFELTQLFTRVGRIQFILMSLVLTGFIFFGRPFIRVWAGVDYYQSFPVALLLMTASFVPAIQTIGIEIQQAKNMHQFQSWVYLTIALGNILLSIPLAQRYGAVGAALGTTVAVIMGNGIIINWYYHKKIGLNIIGFWQDISRFIPSLLPAIVYGFLINQFVDLSKIHYLILSIFIYILIFMIPLWLVGLNDYEKHLVKNPFN